MFKKTKVFTCLALSLVFVVSSAHSSVITLHVPITDDSPLQHLFFHDLLSTALKEIGQTRMALH
ncbi:hypothetical protein [Psychromonas antarctica]|uniref:hypothetical protein n=1 Tax=Psychromonas antarctica TaxID=67573 RepID=UPI001EE8DC2F|nr:hypothetical protein [Psychromonas antarctica]MCG6202728.1 hypothetical protein [Psychromonas antarctica]